MTLGGEGELSTWGFTHRDFGGTLVRMLRVGAGTGLVVSTNVELSANASCNLNDPICQSWAIFSMDLGGQLAVKMVQDGQFPSASPTYSGVASVVYNNFSSVPQDIQFEANGRTYLASVPEPTSLALLLGGALVVASVNRRQV